MFIFERVVAKLAIIHLTNDMCTMNHDVNETQAAKMLGNNTVTIASYVRKFVPTLNVGGVQCGRLRPR